MCTLAIKLLEIMFTTACSVIKRSLMVAGKKEQLNN